MNPKPDQEETAVPMIVRELRENGGHMTHVGKAAFKFARRLLRLNCKYGWNAEKDLDPFLEAAGIDPVKLRVVDHDKFQEVKEAYREKRARKKRRSPAPAERLPDGTHNPALARRLAELIKRRRALP